MTQPTPIPKRTFKSLYDGKTYELDEFGKPTGKIVEETTVPGVPPEPDKPIDLSKKLSDPEPETEGSATSRIFWNTLKTPFKLTGDALSGVINLAKLLEDPNTIPTKEDFKLPSMQDVSDLFDYKKMSQRLQPVGEMLGEAITRKEKQYTTKEGFINDPLAIPLDIASLISPRAWAKGAESLPAIYEALKMAGKTRYLNKYGPEAKNLKFLLQGMDVVDRTGVPKPSTIEDVIKFSKKYGAEVPTAGQMSENPTAFAIEAQNKKGVSKVLESQQKATTEGSQDWLNLFQPNTKEKISIFGDPTTVGGVMRDHAIRGYRSALSQLEISISQNRDDVVNTLAGKNAKFGKELANESSDFVLRKGQELADAARKMGAPDLTLERQNTFLEASLNEANKLGKDPLSRQLLTSRNKTREMLGKAFEDPVREDLLRDPDYSKIINLATTSSEELKRFASLEGIGPQRAAQVLTFKMINDSKTAEGGISALKLYQNLTDPKNIEMMASIMTPKQRAGTQVFAHTMKTYSRYDQAMLDRMAFQAAKQQTGSTVSAVGAGIPKAFGGSFAQMRAGLAGSNTLKLKLESKIISKVLLHPDGGWVLSRLAGSTTTGPSTPGTIRKLVRIMGDMNIPATFVNEQGEETTIPPGSVPVQQNPRGIGVQGN